MQDQLNELKAYVWKRLGVRKFFAGKKNVDSLVEIAVSEWNSEFISHAKTEHEREVVAQGMLIGVKRMHQMLGDYRSEEEYGFVWIILFQALASAIVQILIKWWFESQQNKQAMEEMKRGLVG